MSTFVVCLRFGSGYILWPSSTKLAVLVQLQFSVSFFLIERQGYSYNFSCKKKCPNPTAVSECRSLLVKLLSHPVNEIRSRVYQACCSCIKVRLLPVDYVLYRMAASASMLKVGFKCILINSTN